MAAPDPHQTTQEQSIKARKHQLFEADDLSGEHAPSRSFADCLRETPAAPLSPALKAGLWVLGGVVLLLLLAAFVKVGNRAPKPRPAAAASLDAPAGILSSPSTGSCTTMGRPKVAAGMRPA